MVRTAINLYSVRELNEPLLDILDQVADAGYDGVQFSGGLRDASPSIVVDKLQERNLAVTGAHVGLSQLQDSLHEVQEVYQETLGCDAVVVPWIDEKHFESAEAVAATADLLDDIAAKLAVYDWDLHYHNHAHEFAVMNGELAFERFIAETEEVGIELDVGWALIGGVNPVTFIEDHSNRIDLVHMKDMNADKEHGFCEIGEGDVDMQACADTARNADASWLIYEHDEPKNPAASIKTGATFLNDL